MRIASRGPSSSSTTSTRGSVMPGSVRDQTSLTPSLVRSRQCQDKADLAFLTAQRQSSPVGLDDLLGHAGTDVEELVGGDGERAEQMLALRHREQGWPSGERQARVTGVVQRRLEVDGDAPVGIDAIRQEPDEIADRLAKLLAVDLDDDAL